MTVPMRNITVGKRKWSFRTDAVICVDQEKLRDGNVTVLVTLAGDYTERVLYGEQAEAFLRWLESESSEVTR